MIILRTVKEKDRDLLWNINQKYLYGPYSNIGQSPDYTMAEFTIFPVYRRKHYAFDAAGMILTKHPGKWEIKYNEKNCAAKRLWNTVSAPYAPEVHHLNEEETVLVFEVMVGD